MVTRPGLLGAQGGGQEGVSCGVPHDGGPPEDCLLSTDSPGALEAFRKELRVSLEPKE